MSANVCCGPLQIIPLVWPMHLVNVMCLLRVLESFFLLLLLTNWCTVYVIWFENGKWVFENIQISEDKATDQANNQSVELKTLRSTSYTAI